MMKVIFKDLEQSELLRERTEERFQSVFERFPDLQRSKVTVTLSMENSPRQAGPDLFTVRFCSQGGRYRDIILSKSEENINAALAAVVDHLLEKLNRFGDKIRVKQIKQRADIGKALINETPHS